MEAEASSGNAAREEKGTRRVWSDREEEALINALKKIVATGWKCENGFHSGYLIMLEKAMKKAFPETDIRAQPHIDSKVHVWRKHYGSITTMMSRSGFGWNNGAKMIEVESNHIWDEYVQTDTTAKGMRYKRYPHYHVWQEIFRAGGAIGEHAEDFQNAEDHPLRTPSNHTNSGRNTETAEDLPESDSKTIFVCQPSASNTSKRCWPNKKKKKVDESKVEIVGLMGKFCEQTNHRLGDIAKWVGYECKMSEKREGLFEALGRLSVLTTAEHIYMHRLLSNNNKDCKAFFNLPNTARTQMVRMMLDGQM